MRPHLRAHWQAGDMSQKPGKKPPSTEEKILKKLLNSPFDVSRHVPNQELHMSHLQISEKCGMISILWLPSDPLAFVDRIFSGE